MWERYEISDREAADVITKFHYDREIERLEEVIKMPAFDGFDDMIRKSEESIKRLQDIRRSAGPFNVDEAKEMLYKLKAKEETDRLEDLFNQSEGE